MPRLFGAPHARRARVDTRCVRAYCVALRPRRHPTPEASVVRSARMRGYREAADRECGARANARRRLACSAASTLGHPRLTLRPSDTVVRPSGPLVASAASRADPRTPSSDPLAASLPVPPVVLILGHPRRNLVRTWPTLGHPRPTLGRPRWQYRLSCRRSDTLARSSDTLVGSAACRADARTPSPDPRAPVGSAGRRDVGCGYTSGSPG